MGVCFGKAKSAKPAKSSMDISQRKNPKSLTVFDNTKGRNIDSISLDAAQALDKSANKPTTKQSPAKSKEVLLHSGISVCGQPAKSRQSSYDDKRVCAKGTGATASALSLRGLAYSCKKGFKPDSPNQDDFSIHIQPDYTLLGVYDGHGTSGHDISSFVCQTLPKLIQSDESRQRKPLVTIADSFLKTHQELLRFCGDPNNRVDCKLSGTTATVLLVQGGKLHAGHVGDSRAVLGYVENGVFMARALTNDHKPELPEEKARIEASGGEVKKMPNDVPFRVYKPGKEFPGLAMSRALGDAEAQLLGVSHFAEVNEHTLRPADEFIIVGSDGLWEFITDQEAVDEASKHGRAGVRLSAEALTKLAWDRWISNEDGEIVDDITVVIAYLSNTP